MTEFILQYVRAIVIGEAIIIPLIFSFIIFDVRQTKKREHAEERELEAELRRVAGSSYIATLQFEREHYPEASYSRLLRAAIDRYKSR